PSPPPARPASSTNVSPSSALPAIVAEATDERVGEEEEEERAPPATEASQREQQQPEEAPAPGEAKRAWLSALPAPLLLAGLWASLPDVRLPSAWQATWGRRRRPR